MGQTISHMALNKLRNKTTGKLMSERKRIAEPELGADDIGILLDRMFQDLLKLRSIDPKHFGKVDIEDIRTIAGSLLGKAAMIEAAQ